MPGQWNVVALLISYFYTRMYLLRGVLFFPLFLLYGEARKHVEQLQIDGIWYYNVPEEERVGVQNSLKEHLGLL